MNDLNITQMMEQYERLVYTICYQFTRDHHIAQDLAQDTFVSAFTHLESCPAENPKAWLSRIATNKCKDHLKSAYHRKMSLPGEENGVLEHNALFLTEERPEEIAASNDTLARIADDMQGLADPYRDVAQLYFLEERSVEEIATLLNRPKKTVQTQIYRAKRLLRTSLSQQGLVPAACAC